MTGVHKEQVAITVEPVRLFYVPVNLTIPSGNSDESNPEGGFPAVALNSGGGFPAVGN